MADRKAIIDMLMKQPAVTAGTGVRQAVVQPFQDIANGLGGSMTESEAKEFALLAGLGALPFFRAAKPVVAPAMRAVEQATKTGVEGVGALRGLEVFVPGQRMANARTDLPTQVYHGTSATFPEFKTYPANYSVDPALGTHVAPDPALASSFADRYITAAGDVTRGSPQVHKLRMPAEDKFLTVPQFESPLYAGRKDMPYWQKLGTDTGAIENFAAQSAFKQDPELLARHIKTKYPWAGGRTDIENARMLQGGGKVEFLPYGELDLADYINRHGGRPSNRDDLQRVVDLARQDWQKQGYAGLKYTNTHPTEAGAPSVTNPTSYIVFDPKHLRSEFAQMDPAMANSRDLLSGVLPPVAVGGGVMGSLAAGDRYGE